MLTPGVLWVAAGRQPASAAVRSTTLLRYGDRDCELDSHAKIHVI